MKYIFNEPNFLGAEFLGEESEMNERDAYLDSNKERELLPFFKDTSRLNGEGVKIYHSGDANILNLNE